MCNHILCVWLRNAFKTNKAIKPDLLSNGYFTVHGNKTQISVSVVVFQSFVAFKLHQRIHYKSINFHKGSLLWSIISNMQKNLTFSQNVSTLIHIFWPWIQLWLSVILLSYRLVFSPFMNVVFFSVCRETNLKFKMGLRVTDERLQEERQLAEFNGKYLCVTYRKLNSFQSLKLTFDWEEEANFSFTMFVELRGIIIITVN